MLDFNRLSRFKEFQFEILRLVPEWALAYGVSEEAILRQIPWAHGWCSSNPKKAPKSNVIRFLFNWMRKAKEMGTLRVPEVQAVNPSEIIPPRDMTADEMMEIRRKNFGPLRHEVPKVTAPADDFDLF